MLDAAVNKTVDARGAFCPGPLMELIGSIKTEPVGAIIEILSSDQGSANDIPEWIAKVGHDYLGTEEIEDYWSIIVKKAK
jgi:tRNA 2-thiouridine synthesizing protein A